VGQAVQGACYFLRFGERLVCGPFKFFEAYVRIAGGGIEIYDLIVVIRFADASAYLKKGGRNIEQRMIFLSIAHNETPTVRVDNILPLETGRGVEADGFEFVQCFGDSETFG